MEEKVVVRGKRSNVTLVFAGGSGEDAAYKILADIVMKKFKEKIEGEIKCEQQSMPE